MPDVLDPKKSSGSGIEIVDKIVSLAGARHKGTIPEGKPEGKITWSSGFIDLPPTKTDPHPSDRPIVVRLNIPKGEMIVKGGRQVDTKIVMEHLAKLINESDELKVVKSGLPGQPRTDVFFSKGNWSIIMRAKGPDTTELNPAMKALREGLRKTLDKDSALGNFATNWTNGYGRSKVQEVHRVPTPPKLREVSDDEIPEGFDKDRARDYLARGGKPLGQDPDLIGVEQSLINGDGRDPEARRKPFTERVGQQGRRETTETAEASAGLAPKERPTARVAPPADTSEPPAPTTDVARTTKVDGAGDKDETPVAGSRSTGKKQWTPTIKGARPPQGTRNIDDDPFANDPDVIRGLTSPRNNGR